MQEAHIAQIVQEKFVNASKITEDLNNSLHLLSKYLYEDPARVVIELIQNVEDSVFENCVPNLELELLPPNSPNATHGALIVKSNEAGFTPGNVEAICSVGKSTKNDRLKYIGK